MGGRWLFCVGLSRYDSDLLLDLWSALFFIRYRLYGFLSVAGIVLCLLLDLRSSLIGIPATDKAVRIPSSTQDYEAERCRKTSFCFLYLDTNLFVDIGIENKRGYAVAFCAVYLGSAPAASGRERRYAMQARLHRSQSHLSPHFAE